MMDEKKSLFLRNLFREIFKEYTYYITSLHNKYTGCQKKKKTSDKFPKNNLF